MNTHLSFVIGLPCAAVLLYFFFKGTQWRLQSKRRSKVVTTLQLVAMAGIIVAFVLNHWR